MINRFFYTVAKRTLLKNINVSMMKAITRKNTIVNNKPDQNPNL